MAGSPADIATAYRELYRAKFQYELSTGTRKPFLVPLHMLGVWFLPTLYLAIPHKNRPWLYRARWLVLTAIAILNLHIIRNVSSHNFGTAYMAGLVAAWGIIWNFTLLVWTRPQWDAKRVDVRRTRKLDGTKDGQHGKPVDSLPAAILGNGHATKATSGQQDSLSSFSHHSRQNGNSANDKSGEEPEFARVSGVESDGRATNGVEAVNCVKGRQKRNTTADLPALPPGTLEDLEKNWEESMDTLRKYAKYIPPEDHDLQTMAVRSQEFEYYWQEYPEDAPFLVRLDWAFDIVSTFRMTGWNWANRCLPPYEPPPNIGRIQLPLSSIGPQRTPQGYSRELSYTKFFLTRFFLNVVPSYLILDLCAVYMTADPYFILGPEHGHPLPPHLASLSPLLLSLQRTAFSFVAVVSALQLTLSAGALALAFVPPVPQVLGFRAHPWHLPTGFGSFSQVLDRGLAGFWGAWWHQTFRFGFSAPTKWLVRAGWVRPGTGREQAVAALVAFAQSGFLHASASYATVPRGSRWWLPPLFFLLAGVGTTLQSWLARAVFRAWIERMPRWVRRLGNLAYVLGWMWLTSWALVDDFGRCGLWLYEPVPVSIARALGIGPTRDRRVWRLERDFWPWWHWGKHWWDTGLGV
ncbi:membrane bound O-acyl transferase family-domain-containing protein [Hypoxylon sp. FL1150]|nr:membrane bound O-acyl transferase family-domain-containing protein [Hypoxylon sp. FL1150]